jgi:hypothetical protein
MAEVVSATKNGEAVVRHAPQDDPSTMSFDHPTQTLQLFAEPEIKHSL